MAIDELLIAALAALEDASWEVMGKARNAFIRVFSRKLADELRELGYEGPDEQLSLVFEDYEVRDSGDRVVIEVRNCPFCVVEELADRDEPVETHCVVSGWLEALFDGVIVGFERKDRCHCVLEIERRSG